jgi:hypothetical protein
MTTPSNICYTWKFTSSTAECAASWSVPRGARRRSCDLSRELLFHSHFKQEVAETSQQRIFQFVTQLLPSRRKPRRKVLRVATQGLIRKRRPRPTAASSIACRLSRFIKNHALDPRDAVEGLSLGALALRSSSWMPGVMDDTGPKGQAMLLGAAIVHRGRAPHPALYACSLQLVRKSACPIQ